MIALSPLPNREFIPTVLKMTTPKLKKLLLPSCLILALSPALAPAEKNGATPIDLPISEPIPEPIDFSNLANVHQSDLDFDGDTVSIRYNGSPLQFEVSRSEFFVKDRLSGESNIESFADPFGTADEMRRFVSSEDSVWGQDCKLVLYKAGMPKVDENRILLTHKIEIKLDPEHASMEVLNQLAEAVGIEVGSNEMRESGLAWMRATCAGSAIKAAEILSGHETVLWARPLPTMPLVKAALPNDQFYTVSDQFYIHHDSIEHINAFPVWCGFAPLQQGYFGRGVEINLLDDGVEGEHPDLERTYLFRNDTDFVDGDDDGGPGGFQDNHGTQMAGIINARHNNGIGIAGIAPAARLYSSRVFGADSDPQIMSDAHEHERNSVDLIVSGFVPGGNYVDISELLEDTLFSMAERRNVPICYPAGGAGGGARMDYDRIASHRHTIATAAYEAPSEPGCSIIVGGHGRPEMATTDRTGEDGDDPSDYFFEFGGTSAANACTAGLVALMKDARPDLGWRDYQEILLLTGIKDPTHVPNGAGVVTPYGAFPFMFSYQSGGGFHDGFAVALAEIWALLPDSASLYRVVDHKERINEEIGAAEETYLFNFNQAVPSKRNMRIEHIELIVEWEEPPNGAAPDLLPAYIFLVPPYYTDGNIDRPTPTTGNGSLLSERSEGINAPVKWTYTTVRHWGLTNAPADDGSSPPGTGGFDRINVPNQTRLRSEQPPGVWEVDVAVQPRIVEGPDGQPDPSHPDSQLTRELVSMEMVMYGTENNVPPNVVSASISSSGNPGVFSPRTAFTDEDLLVEDIVFFDQEGDPLTVIMQWQELNEDGLTWDDLGSPIVTASDCEFDQFVKITARNDFEGDTWDRYFIVTQPNGLTVGYYFEDPVTGSIPAGVQTADRVVPITGVAENDSATVIASLIRDAVNGDAASGLTAVVDGDPDGEQAGDLLAGQVALLYGLMHGPIPSPDAGTSGMRMSVEASQDAESGNCFGPISTRLDASMTQTERKYRVVITPRDGLREGFRFIADEIIVNSRPIPDAAHGVEYVYDTDLWIETVPPEGLSPFLFINEFSQGTGDRTTNREWVEIMVNFTSDLRGYKLTNDIAGFDVTLTQNPVWEEVQFGTIIVIYNGDEKDPIIPPDTPIADFPLTSVWIVSSNNGSLFELPANGDGWGEFSNIDCTLPGADEDCDGAHAALLTPFGARDPIHGISFNGDMQYTDVGVVSTLAGTFFNGTGLLPGPPDGPTDPLAWVPQAAADATPGSVNSANNQTVLDTINLEAKTSVPTYRFYPGDGSQSVIDPLTGHPVLDDADLPIPDVVPSDMVPGLTIDRKTGVVTGVPDVPLGGTFTIKIQRFHSFSSEIQIYELVVLEAPPLVDTDDEDDDGLINLLEEALGADPFAAQPNILPVGGTVSVFGPGQFPAITFRRLKGGVRDVNDVYTFEDLVYTVEASTDLITWGTRESMGLPVFQTTSVDSVDLPDTVEVVTYRYATLLSTAEPGDRVYLRLRVTRLEDG